MREVITFKNAKKLQEVADKYKVKLPGSCYMYWESEDNLKYDKLQFRGRTMIEGELYLWAYNLNELSKWLSDYISSIHHTKEECYILSRSGHDVHADTFKNALCLLAIELIKNKIIK